MIVRYERWERDRAVQARGERHLMTTKAWLITDIDDGFWPFGLPGQSRETGTSREAQRERHRLKAADLF